MEFSIRKGHKEDMESVYRLIHELAIYENEPDAVKISVDDLINDGFKEDPEFEVFVAEVKGTIVGMALYYKRYSTWEGKSLHLEDLIVNKEYRGKGIGKALYIEVMRTAYDNDINRVEWEVIDWNKPAINFYLSTGATMIENWNLCQMNRKNLKIFLDKHEGI
ncbi:MAG: GNAT family N-acetyltransferase [Flavobacteriaceae bacterium]|nr:GNAT family N-acetyltransferase [Flavobacteriaceae bacterium]